MTDNKNKDSEHSCDLLDQPEGEECQNYGECPVCDYPFHICEIFPEPGLGGVEQVHCNVCYNVFDVSEEIQLVYEVHDAQVKNGNRD